MLFSIIYRGADGIQGLSVFQVCDRAAERYFDGFDSCKPSLRESKLAASETLRVPFPRFCCRLRAHSMHNAMHRACVATSYPLPVPSASSFSSFAWNLELERAQAHKPASCSEPSLRPSTVRRQCLPAPLRRTPAHLQSLAGPRVLCDSPPHFKTTRTVRNRPPDRMEGDWIPCQGARLKPQSYCHTSQQRSPAPREIPHGGLVFIQGRKTARASPFQPGRCQDRTAASKKCSGLH